MQKECLRFIRIPVLLCLQAGVKLDVGKDCGATLVAKLVNSGMLFPIPATPPVMIATLPANRSGLRLLRIMHPLFRFFTSTGIYLVD